MQNFIFRIFPLHFIDDFEIISNFLIKLTVVFLFPLSKTDKRNLTLRLNQSEFDISWFKGPYQKNHKILNFSYLKYLFIAKWTFQLHAPFKEILNCIIVARSSSADLNHCKKETEMAYVWDPSHIGRLRWLFSNFIDKMCPEWKFLRHGTKL